MKYRSVTNFLLNLQKWQGGASWGREHEGDGEDTDRNLNSKWCSVILLFFDSASRSNPQRHHLVFFSLGQWEVNWGGQHDLLWALLNYTPGSVLAHCFALVGIAQGHLSQHRELYHCRRTWRLRGGTWEHHPTSPWSTEWLWLEQQIAQADEQCRGFPAHATARLEGLCLLPGSQPGAPMAPPRYLLLLWQQQKQHWVPGVLLSLLLFSSVARRAKPWLSILHSQGQRQLCHRGTLCCTAHAVWGSTTAAPTPRAGEPAEPAPAMATAAHTWGLPVDILKARLPCSQEQAAKTDVNVNHMNTEEEVGTPFEGPRSYVNDYMTPKRNHKTSQIRNDNKSPHAYARYVRK